MTAPEELAVADAFTLAGRVAVITGAASGIGRQAALTFTEAGAQVVLADIDEDGLAQTADEVAALGGKPVPLRTDVTSRDEVEALARHAVEAGGRLDVWANVAGILLPSLVVDTTEETLDRMIGINIKGLYWGCAAAARIMTAQGHGSIINISSAGADIPQPGLSVYSFTKSAVKMITRTLAHEVGPQGVRVNTVAPGFVDTPMVTYRFRRDDGSLDEDKRAALFQTRADQSILGVIGTTSDITMAMLYLASDASRFVTGQTLRPNGGIAMP
jgi:3-oxoacyl-[acyl-carrier protein] reductase